MLVMGAYCPRTRRQCEAATRPIPAGALRLCRLISLLDLPEGTESPTFHKPKPGAPTRLRRVQTWATRLLDPRCVDVPAVLMKNEACRVALVIAFESDLSLDHFKEEIALAFGKYLKARLVCGLDE
jgi:hypothetical protein